MREHTFPNWGSSYRKKEIPLSNKIHKITNSIHKKPWLDTESEGAKSKARSYKRLQGVKIGDA